MPVEQADSDKAAIAALKTKLGGFETEEGRLGGLAYEPKNKDEVIITTTPKAGKTSRATSIRANPSLLRKQSKAQHGFNR